MSYAPPQATAAFVQRGLAYYRVSHTPSSCKPIPQPEGKKWLAGKLGVYRILGSAPLAVHDDAPTPDREVEFQSVVCYTVFLYSIRG